MKGLMVNQYGVFCRETGERVAGKTEESVYEAIGEEYKNPEKR